MNPRELSDATLESVYADWRAADSIVTDRRQGLPDRRTFERMAGLCRRGYYPPVVLPPVAPPAPSRKSWFSYRKVGGLRFVRFGRVGFVLGFTQKGE